MKITEVETFLVPPRWLFVRIATDEGLVGWGEPILEGRAATVRAAVEELSDYLVGADPLAIEDHWQLLTKGGFYRGGPILGSAVAGIDQALWDLAGKAYDQPVYRLLGGPVRQRARVYAWVGGDSADTAVEDAEAQVEAGFTAIKMTAGPMLDRHASRAAVAKIISNVASVRAAVGEDCDIAVDFHGRISVPLARQILPMLEPFHLLFVEEPVLPQQTAAMRCLVASTTIPLATGERLYSRWEFQPMLEAGVAVVQPDVSHAGGISEMRRIAALAEIYDASLAPHCPLGPIALAASAQVAFATPNFLIQEQSIGIHYNGESSVLDYVLDRAPFQFTNGQMSLPSAPGLGIEIDESAVRAADKIGHRWRNPIWRRSDGSLAEW